MTPAIAQAENCWTSSQKPDDIDNLPYVRMLFQISQGVLTAFFEFEWRLQRSVIDVLTLSKRVEYALMAILHMAGAPPTDWSSSKGIAERYSIPPELMGKVLQALARASIVSSAPGVNGGYRLQQPIGRINLGMVIEAVEGPVVLANCQQDPDRCEQYHMCTIKEPIQQLHAQLVRFIHSIPLSQFRAPQPLETAR